MTPSHWPRHNLAGKKPAVPDTVVEVAAASNLDRARLVRLAGDVRLPLASSEVAGAEAKEGEGRGVSCCKLTNTGKR